MFRRRNILAACFAEYLLCLVIFLTYAFTVTDAKTGFTVCAVCIAFFVIPLLLCAFKRIRGAIPYIFNMFFVSSCLLLSIITDTPVYMPLVFMTLAVTVSFFLEPRINVWLTAATNIALLVTFFIYPDAIRHFVPLAVFVLMTVLYDFVMVSLIVLVYTFRKNLVNIQRRLTAALRTDYKKNAFWESAAHEIHTPINVINGLCQLMLRNTGDGEIRERTYEIQSAGKDLLAILNSAYDYTRLETHKLKISDDRYVFMSFLNDIVNFCSTKTESEKVDFIVECAPDIPSELYGDCARISQVVMNLFANAVKFTKSGSITLGFSAREYEGKINLRITVSDTGTGISRKKMSKLFTVYSDQNDGTKPNSTHLGLGVSKELVKLMGGFINVRSAVGKGSFFSVTIPQGIADKRPFIEINGAQQLKVLMFTEKTHSREAMEKLFSSLGIDMTFCASNSEFMIEKENPGYTHVITDYNIFTFNKPIFDILSQRMEIIVPKAMDLKEEKTAPYVRSVFYPIYAASLASVFNSESGKRGTNGFTVSFTAPRANVLVVDDNIVNIKVAGSFLLPYNMNVYTADNGEDALKTVQSRHIDLVFMDHVMPHPDGIETTAMIRALGGDYAEKLPIVALTANAHNDVKKLFLENGMNDFISKPIEMRALEHVLLKWLPGEMIVKLDEPIKIDIGELPEKSYGLLDVKQGIINVGGSKEAYFDVLKTFAASRERTAARLSSSLRERNMELFTITAHSVKGASRNIGAAELSEFARQLEAASKQNELVLLTERTPILCHTLERVCGDIESYLLDNGQKIKGAPDYKSVIPKLESAVAEGDSSAAESILEDLLDCSVSENCRSCAQKALDCVNNFNFAGASKEIKHLREIAE